MGLPFPAEASVSIQVKQVDPETFEVEVAGATPTRHVVTAPEAYISRLTGGGAEVAELIQASFEFLLEREPNTSILQSFELSVTQSYFPEYERAMALRFGG